MKDDLTNETLKALPPTAVATLSLFGIGLQDWVYALTIVYLIVQIVLTVFKYFKGKKRK